MIEETQPEKMIEKKKPRFGLKSKLIFFLILVLVVISGSFYLYIQQISSLKTEYNNSLQSIETLNNEKSRCLGILSQDGGKFGDYEYCRQLLQIFPTN